MERYKENRHCEKCKDRKKKEENIGACLLVMVRVRCLKNMQGGNSSMPSQVGFHASAFHGLSFPFFSSFSSLFVCPSYFHFQRFSLGRSPFFFKHTNISLLLFSLFPPLLLCQFGNYFTVHLST